MSVVRKNRIDAVHGVPSRAWRRASQYCVLCKGADRHIVLTMQTELGVELVGQALEKDRTRSSCANRGLNPTGGLNVTGLAHNPKWIEGHPGVSLAARRQPGVATRDGAYSA